MAVICPICRTRKARRACPAVEAAICPQCCGEQREVTLRCPLECAYLREARVHEKLQPITSAEVPHWRVEVTEEFLRGHQLQLVMLASALFVSAVNVDGAIDADVHRALTALVARWQGDEAIRPEGEAAAQVFDRFLVEVERLHQNLHDEARARFWPPETLLRLLVFLDRMAVGRDNGRPLGRAYLSFLEDNFARTMQKAGVV